MNTEYARLLGQQYFLERQLEEAEGRVDQDRENALWQQIEEVTNQLALLEHTQEEERVVDKA